MENAKADIARYTEEIRQRENDCEEIRRNCNVDLEMLKQKMDDEKRCMLAKENELSSLHEEKRKLDDVIAKAEKRLEALRDRM